MTINDVLLTIILIACASGLVWVVYKMGSDRDHDV